MRRPGSGAGPLFLVLAGGLCCARNAPPKESPEERQRVLQELAALDDLERRGEPDSLYLRQALGHPSPYVRARAARALGRTRAPGDPLPLASVLLAYEDHPESDVRREAAFALGRMGDPGAVLVLRQAAVEDPDPLVRAASIHALGRFEAIPEKTWDLPFRDEDPRVQVEAVLAAARMEPFPTLDWWQARIDGAHDERVRWAIFAAIASRPELAAALEDRLIAAAGDPNFLVSAYAFLALRGNDSPVLRAKRDLVASDPRRSTVEREAALGSAPPGRLLARWGGTWQEPPYSALPYPPPYPLIGPGGAPRIRNARAEIRIAGKGAILIDLFAADAPHHTSSFLELARRGWYAGRRIEDVDPTAGILVADAAAAGGTLAGAPLPDEIHYRPIRRGSVLSPPRAGIVLIAHLPLPHLEGRVTCWGAVTIGMEILDGIEPGDLIEAVEPR